MRTIFSILLGLLFIGCGNDFNPKPKEGNTLKKEMVTDSNIENLEGKYVIESGDYLFSDNNKIKSPITESNLVIEKLDNNDYGYYLTLRVENLTPTIDSGIIHKRETGGFFKKIIYDPNIEDANTSKGKLSDENLTEDMIDEDEQDSQLTSSVTDKEIKITKVGKVLKMYMPVSNHAIASVTWVQVDKLEDSELLNEAQHDYIETYKKVFLKNFKDLD